MKMFKFLLVMLALLFSYGEMDAQKKAVRQVVFKADLHCKSCQAKVEKNIPFEKGVKDLKVDLAAKTITVSYREDKNTAENLCKAIEKLHIKVLEIDGKACSRTGKAEGCPAGR